MTDGADFSAEACPLRFLVAAVHISAHLPSGGIVRLFLTAAMAATMSTALAAPAVPTDVQLPGTQPFEIAAHSSPDTCKTCHAGTANPAFEPWTGWQGSMMSHAARDPLFWAALAVAEQDFLPDADPALRGGAGDFCLRCHLPNGWLGGRSTPTDGSAMDPATDANGVECMHCHLLVNPDPAVNVAGTVEQQVAPFVANDGSAGWHGSGMYVLNSEGTRLGPYSTINPPHPFLPSAFHRQGELCGTCHDVSNPAVGDLAPNNGAQAPLPPGQYSGAPGGAVTTKAAFKNAPHAYGVVERTFSEWKAGAFDTLLVNDFATLPAELQTPGGSIEVARSRAWRTLAATANYEDGTPRTYTCQTCHMSAARGKGCVQGNAPTRVDLPRHDLAGAGHWVPAAIVWQETQGTLRFGAGLAADQKDAMTAGQARAVEMLQSAALLELSQAGPTLEARVTNLTGHKLITGYPEGRRMWLNVRFYDAPGGAAGGGSLVAEQGAYGSLGFDVNGSCAVESLIDPAGTVIFDAEPGIDQAWAAKLLTLGHASATALVYDRVTGAVTDTLGSLAAEAPGTTLGTFHFALNNVLVHDTRIPPYGFDYDEAAERNALPVPATQFGNPGPGGTFAHWSDHGHAIPALAQSATVTLHYQQTSWEYVQFLWLHNDGQSAFLGAEGANLLDAWCNTGKAAPVTIASATTDLSPVVLGPGEAPDATASYSHTTGGIVVTYSPACNATDHAVVRGPLAAVSSYGYTAADCAFGSTGTLAFTPGAGDEFFLVVGNDGVEEGAYGSASSGTARPERTGGGCDFPLAAAPTCDP